MYVVNCFGGMEVGRLALDRLGITPTRYYSSEIDPHAMKIASKNYPDIIQLGDVNNWRDWDIEWKFVDLVMGGFPCQAWSVAGKQQGDRDPRGQLFWVMLDIMKHVMECNPNAKYLMENVRMSNAFEKYITHHTEQALPNVNKYLINSSLVSAQNRQRWYWTNITGIEQPEQRGIVLRDILENDAEEPMYSNIYGGFGEKKPREHFDKSVTIRANSGGGSIPNVKLKDFDKNLARMTTKEGKAYCLTASYQAAVPHNSLARSQRSMIPVITGGALRARSVNAEGKNVACKETKPKQMLELRKDDKSNAISSVNKDSVVTETITIASQWQEVADKALKGGVQLINNQQNLVLDTLESYKKHFINGKKRFSKIFA